MLITHSVNILLVRGCDMLLKSVIIEVDILNHWFFSGNVHVRKDDLWNEIIDHWSEAQSMGIWITSEWRTLIYHILLRRTWYAKQTLVAKFFFGQFLSLCNQIKLIEIASVFGYSQHIYGYIQKWTDAVNFLHTCLDVYWYFINQILCTHPKADFHG